MNILVTGGAGFIASSLIDALAELPDCHIVAIDNLLTGRLENIGRQSNVRFIRGDVNDSETMRSIMTATPFDFVFHYAAVVGVARTLQQPMMVLDDITGIRNVLELSKNTGVKRVFFSSSSEVYGEPVEVPQHEERTPLNARLPYAVVKSIGECFCRAFYQEHGLPFTILRFFNMYGPKQSSDFVISRFLEQALAGLDITLYGEGDQTRTFCYIEDNVAFTSKILQQGLFINDVVNVGHDAQHSIRQLADLIVQLCGSKSRIVSLPPLKEGDMRRRQPDNSKMRSALGRELVSLQDGLQRLIQHRLSLDSSAT